MEQTIVFYITTGKLIIAIFVFFISLFGLVWKGKSEIAQAIKESIGDFKDRFISMESKMEVLWKDELAPSHSPRQLNERGNTILIQSGIKEIVDEKKTKLFELVKTQEPKSPYDAEAAIADVMKNLPEHCPDIVEKLKDGAFKTGSNIESILFVGSVYLRNEIFSDLGFSLTDLDEPKQLPRVPKTE